MWKISSKLLWNANTVKEPGYAQMSQAGSLPVIQFKNAMNIESEINTLEGSNPLCMNQSLLRT